MEIGNGSFQNAEEFKYLGRTVTNETLIEEKIERRFNLGNACHQFFENLLSFCLLSGNVKFRIYKTIILPVVLYRCEAWCLTRRGGHSVRLLRRIFYLRSDGVIGVWRKLHDEELRNLYSLPSIVRMIKSWRVRRAGKVARMGRGGMHIGF
jgi:hypothetical protein